MNLSKKVTMMYEQLMKKVWNSLNVFLDKFMKKQKNQEISFLPG
jgi:hypothetical protein